MRRTNDFTPGDTVTLISGGPVMTVGSVDKSVGGELFANVFWFSSGKVERDRLPLSTLRLVDDGHKNDAD